MTTGNNSISNGFSWALLEIKSGNKVARSGWDNAEGYLAITKDEGNKFISLVYQDGGYKKWQETHEDLLAEDWISYSEEIETPQEKIYHIKGVVTIGSYFHTGSQHNYGYYSGWGIGEFKLTSTDIFDPETVAVKTCCGYDKSIYNKKNGFLFQIAQDNTSKLIKFLQNNPAAPLTVFIGNNQYKLGRYTGLSNRNNYFWEDGEVQQLLDNCFNKNNINKSYPIILQFEIDNLSV